MSTYQLINGERVLVESTASAVHPSEAIKTPVQDKPQIKNRKPVPEAVAAEQSVGSADVKTAAQ